MITRRILITPSLKNIFLIQKSFKGSCLFFTSKLYFSSKIQNKNYNYKESIVSKTVKTPTIDWKPLKSSKNPNDENTYKSIWKSPLKLIFLALMIAMPIVSFNLGLWQYRRLNWKTKLVSTCEERLVLPELSNTAVFFDDVLRNDQDLDAINEKIEENWQYRKVKLRGEFDHFGELFVGPRVKNGYKGYQLFTPFTILDDGTNEGKWNGKRVLIERGWISENHILPNSRTLQHLSVPKGYVEVDCLIRVYRKLTNLQWEREDKNSRLWNVIDFPEMCHEANDALPIYFQALYDLNDHLWVPKDGTVNIATSKTYDSNKWWNPFGRNNDSKGNSKTGKTPVKYVDTHKGMEFNEAQLIKAGVPIGKLPKVDFKNNHLQYLVTWFGLSFLSSIFLILALKKYAKPNVMKSSEAQKARMKRFKDFM